MRLLMTAGVLIAWGVALAAPVPKEKPKVKDEDAIQGTWLMQKYEGDDTPPDVGPIRITFTDGQMAIDLGGQHTDKGTYKLDPTAKVKAIDLIHGNETTPAIYELDGDTLRICVPDTPKQGRPTEFKGGKVSSLITLNRDKDGKKEK